MKIPKLTLNLAIAAALLAILAAIGPLIPPSRAAAGDQPIRMNGAAPELTGDAWLNTPNQAPITLASRLGKVTIVHFWTFGCINCRHNLPSYARWHKQFADKDVLLIGVHTPEFSTERVPANVARQVRQLGIEYPVLLDPDYANWNRWHQQFWPAVYLIDKQSRVRYRWEGELNYRDAGGEARIAHLVEQLLQE